MKIQFKVKRKIYRDIKTNFTIFTAKVLKYEGNKSGHPITSEMSFKGIMHNFKEKDTYTAEAHVDLDPQRGLFIQIESVEIERLEYEDEIVNYIKKYTKGIGKELIEPIVKAFGINTVEIIGSEDGYKKIKELKIPKLGEKRIKAIREAIINHRNYEEVMIFLELHSLSVSLTPKIVDNLGKESLIDLKKNPYQLIRYIDFNTLDRIGYHYLNTPRDVNRIMAGIYSYIKDDIDNNGNVYTEKTDVRENLNQYLENLGIYEGFKIDDKLFEEALTNVVEEGLLKLVTEGNKTYIYRKDMSFMEKRIAERIVELNECNVSTCGKSYIMERIRKFEEAKNIKLDECQVEAVLGTLRSAVSVLNGGPGTGKTFTTNLIKTIYKEVNPQDKILLLAPTGKASKRLAELCGEEAMTVHRGLKIRPLEQVNEDDKLEADFIIIDEASMIDIQMLYNLLVKIGDNTKVLFVGDYQQLPSVGAGLVLRDLINCGEVYVTKLEKIFRQALESNIVHNSHMMIQGKQEGYKFENDTFLLNIKNIKQYETKILKTIEKVESKGYTIDDIVILTPTRKRDLGTRMLNAMLQEKYNKNNAKEDIYVLSDVNVFKKGDKVMHTKNNYDLEVYNGEVGRVVGMTHKLDKSGKLIGDTLTVDYTDRLVTYSRKDVIELELAYAMTIHKSQGSEYPIVISIVSDLHTHMLNRNLIYTAWTRAKDKLYILGQEEAVKLSAEKNDIINRKSRLVELIQKLSEKVF